MYLREMGLNFIWRGKFIAKRIEAGKDVMLIALQGHCSTGFLIGIKNFKMMKF